MEPELLYLQGLQSTFMPARYLIGVKANQAVHWRQNINNALGIFHNPVAALVFRYGLYDPFTSPSVYHSFMNSDKTASHVLCRQGTHFRPAERPKSG